MGGHNSKITVPYNTPSSKNFYDNKVNQKVIETALAHNDSTLSGWLVQF